MTDEKSLVTPEAIEIAISTLSEGLDFPFDTESVDWLEVREAILPQGNHRPAESLVDTEFTIFRVKPFEGAYKGARTIVYWVVGGNDDGEVFNTVLGGQVVCEALDAIVGLNNAAAEAQAAGETEIVNALIAKGAGRALRVRLVKEKSGKGRDYYNFV